MSTPTVSIIMPVKNAELYLRECLESIICQSMNEWELIAVDDNSDDNSYTILIDYMKRDDRINVLKNSGTGIIDALKMAFQNAQAKYITRMDSDDIMSADKIESLYQKLNSFGTGHIAVGLVEYFSKSGVGVGYGKYAQWLNEMTIKGTNFTDIYRECPIPSPCWMVDREDLLKCEAFNPSVYPEDYDLAFRFKKKRLKIVPVKRIIHHWRDHPDRASRTDPNYSDNRFSELKVTHFLNQDRDYKLPLTVWGAGNKGKKIAQLLNQRGEEFIWICNNPNKVGQVVYNLRMNDLSQLGTKEEMQVIIGISSFHDDKEIKNITEEYSWHQYFYFF